MRECSCRARSVRPCAPSKYNKRTRRRNILPCPESERASCDNRSTDSERRLWHWLRNRQIDGVKFRRQVPLGPYVVDFMAADRRLVIEIDGGQHALRQDFDQRRTAWLEEQGYQVIRFWSNEVLANTEGVIEAIGIALKLRPPHPDPLPPSGARGIVKGARSTCCPSHPLLVQLSTAPAPRPYPRRTPVPDGGWRPGSSTAAPRHSASPPPRPR